MATYTYTIDDALVSIVTAACAKRGTKAGEPDKDGNPTSVPWGIVDYFQDAVNGHIATFKAYAEQEDATAKENKLTEYETIKPVYDKYEALQVEEAKIVNDLFDGKITAKDIVISEIAVKP